jgi:hypothetical protein
MDNLPVRGFRGIKFDLPLFTSFIDEKKKEYCNGCNDDVTDSVTDRNDNRKDDVTVVTLWTQILSIWKEREEGFQNARDENQTSLQTQNPVENVVTDSGVNGPKSCNASVTNILERCLAIILRAKNPISPFTLAIHSEGLECPIKPKDCAEWLRSKGYVESEGKWSL